MTERRRIYRAAAYCRKSHDDGDRAESESISNQRHMIEDFCARSGELALVESYVDDGFTGTNFERPAFKRLIADIAAGKIDCVVVKDLSRFGRDYIGMGYYLEQYFTERDVRFIAIHDRIDSERGPYDMMLPLRNILNTQYARDVSQKVRKTFRAKQERGEYVGAFAPYGYVKDPSDKNRFLVDDEAASVVRRIYDLYAQGLAFSAIARTLNREGVASPLAYKHQHGMPLCGRSRSEQTLWSPNTVRSILRNAVYLGHMVSNRYPSDRMHGKTRQTPPDEWIVVKNTHCPVVTPEQWARAQERLANRPPCCAKAAAPSLFRGILRCGACGHAMVGRGGEHGKTYWCKTRKTHGVSACANRPVSEQALAEVILGDLNRIIQSVDDLGETVLSAASKQTPANREQAAPKKLEAAIRKIERSKRSAYEAYRSGALTRSEFMQRKAEYEAQTRALAKLLHASAPTQKREEPQIWAKELLNLRRLTELDRETIEQAVKRIVVWPDARIEIAYLFSGELKDRIESTQV